VTAPASTLVARFATLCGATVDMRELAQPNSAGYAHIWECRGCGETGPAPAPAGTARRNANEHAGQCRSMPLPR